MDRIFAEVWLVATLLTVNLNFNHISFIYIDLSQLWFYGVRRVHFFNKHLLNSEVFLFLLFQLCLITFKRLVLSVHKLGVGLFHLRVPLQKLGSFSRVSHFLAAINQSLVVAYL